MGNFLKSIKSFLLGGKSAVSSSAATIAQETQGVASRTIKSGMSAAKEISDYPIRKAGNGVRPGMMASTASVTNRLVGQQAAHAGSPIGALFPGQVRGATRPLMPAASVDRGLDLPIRKGRTPGGVQTADHIFPGRSMAEPFGAKGESYIPAARSQSPFSKAPYSSTDPDLPMRRSSNADLPGRKADLPMRRADLAGTRADLPGTRADLPDRAADLPIRKGTTSPAEDAQMGTLARREGGGSLARRLGVRDGEANGALAIRDTRAVTAAPEGTGQLARRKGIRDGEANGALAIRNTRGEAPVPEGAGDLARRKGIRDGEANGALAIRRTTGSAAPPAPGVNPAAPPASAETVTQTGAQAARTASVDNEVDAAFGQATSGKSNGPEAFTAPPITKMQDPSRLIDWAVGPGIGAAIGGAEGFINYDESKERDPLMKETPFIARMKAAGEGAAKGAGYGLAAVTGERAMVGIGKSLMSYEERMMMPGPISLTEAFTKGFSSTAGASGTDSMGGIANRVTGAFDESSGYVAAVRADKGIKAEAAISAKIGQVEADASEAAIRQAASGTATATAATAPAAAAAPAARRYTVNAPPADFRPGSMTASTPTQGVGSAAPAAGSTPGAAVATPAAATPAPTTPAPSFMPSSVRNRTTPAPAPAPAPAAATPAAAATPSPTVTAATEAANRNAPGVQARVQVEQLNKQRAKIRDNTVNSMMQLPDHMTPERISSIVNSSRGLVDAGVIGATAVGALAGTPILMAKQAIYNYKEHVLKPNEKTSQVSAGFSRIQNPWMSEGQAIGDYGIRDTLAAQIGDGPIASKVIAAGVVATVGGAASFGAMSATSYGGGPGHPMNALMMRDPAISAKAQMDADASNKIRMSDPSQLGLADAEEMYYTNPSMRPVQSRSRPGMYNDTGNLTLALSALRRG